MPRPSPQTPKSQPYTVASKLLAAYLKAGVPAVTKVTAAGDVVITPVAEEAAADDLSMTNWARK